MPSIACVVVIHPSRVFREGLRDYLIEKPIRPCVLCLKH